MASVNKDGAPGLCFADVLTAGWFRVERGSKSGVVAAVWSHEEELVVGESS